MDTNLQQGTTFTIYLPETDERPQSVDPPPETSLPVGNEKVLLVEDDEAVRAFAASVLRRVGYSIREAATPLEALAISNSADVPFDLVLTDVVMPGMNGRQMADRLLVQRPDAKVLFISGYNETFFGRGLLNAAHDTLLQKPFTADALLRKVRQVLDADTIPVPEDVAPRAASVGQASWSPNASVGRTTLTTPLSAPSPALNMAPASARGGRSSKPVTQRGCDGV